MTAAEQARAFERWQARMAAWAQSMWKAQAAEKRARQAHRERAAVFDDPKASLAEVAAAALEQSGVSDSARANMSAAAKTRERRKKISFPKDVVPWGKPLAGVVGESADLTRPKGQGKS